MQVEEGRRQLGRTCAAPCSYASESIAATKRQSQTTATTICIPSPGEAICVPNDAPARCHRPLRSSWGKPRRDGRAANEGRTYRLHLHVCGRGSSGNGHERGALEIAAGRSSRSVTLSVCCLCALLTSDRSVCRWTKVRIGPFAMWLSAAASARTTRTHAHGVRTLGPSASSGHIAVGPVC